MPRCHRPGQDGQGGDAPVSDEHRSQLWPDATPARFLPTDREAHGRTPVNWRPDEDYHSAVRLRRSGQAEVPERLEHGEAISASSPSHATDPGEATRLTVGRGHERTPVPWPPALSGGYREFLRLVPDLF